MHCPACRSRMSCYRNGRFYFVCGARLAYHGALDSFEACAGSVSRPTYVKNLYAHGIRRQADDMSLPNGVVAYVK